MEQNNIFLNYVRRKSANTLSAQSIDLGTFIEYLNDAKYESCPTIVDLQTNPTAWHILTFQIVEDFLQWMLKHGYAISSVNRKLSTIRVYSKLAMMAGTLDLTEFALIRNMASYSQRDAKHMDPSRAQTRKGAKKARKVILTYEQAQILKKQPNTPQGCRDSLLMCLLLEHGLRVGEVALLNRSDFDLLANQFTVYRPKSDESQTFKMTPDTGLAVQNWFEAGYAPASGYLLRGSRSNGSLTEGGFKIRSIKARVQFLGKNLLSIDNLSSEDCRHYWATRAIEMGTDIIALRDAGGWKSLAMPSRYISPSEIANQRLKL